MKKFEMKKFEIYLLYKIPKFNSKFTFGKKLRKSKV